MKVNYVGIIGGILAFISLALPWWTMNMSISAGGEIPIPGPYSVDISIYPYKGTVSASIMGIPISMDISINVWYGWAALVLVVVGGILGILGSIISGNKVMLVVGGILALLSIIIFAAGLQIELSQGMSIPPPTGTGTPLQLPALGLFSSGSFVLMDVPVNYSTYLSFGFWIALIAAILMFVAMRKAEKVAPPPTPVEAPAPPPPPP
ncbi:MAG: hypothetical protein QXR89_01905 [Candidatus Bathyarchaeia archaeon]